MVDQTSHMFITGPDVIKTVTGEDVGFEELGGARTHNTTSGVAHHMAGDEKDAIEYVKALLSYLPSNNLSEPPAFAEEADLDGHRRGPGAGHAHPGLGEPAVRHAHGHRARPGRRRVPGDAGAVRAEHHHRLRPGRGPPGGHRRQPADAVRRLPGHRRLARRPHASCAPATPSTSRCITFVDVPGFLPGVDQEYDGIIRRGAKLIYAYAEATVPLITVITRKAFGGAYDVMGSKHLGADLNLAWPTAQIAVMGAQGAVNILHRRTIAGRRRPATPRRPGPS